MNELTEISANSCAEPPKHRCQCASVKAPACTLHSQSSTFSLQSAGLGDISQLGRDGEWGGGRGGAATEQLIALMAAANQRQSHLFGVSRYLQCIAGYAQDILAAPSEMVPSLTRVCRGGGHPLPLFFPLVNINYCGPRLSPRLAGAF